MVNENLQDQYVKYHLKKYQTCVYEYSKLDETIKNSFIEFCNIAIKEKYSFNTFIQESEKYPLEENIKWYALAITCVNKILSTRQSIIKFFGWFRHYSHTDASFFYEQSLHEKLQDKKLLNIYKKKLNVKEISNHINKTSIDGVDKSEKEAFECFLEKENNDILDIFNNRHRMHYRYMSNGFLYYALTPILDIDTSLVVKILSKIDCILEVEEFLTINIIIHNIDLICKILFLSPNMINNKGVWDNKKYLLPLLTLTLNEHLIGINQAYNNINDVNTENILKDHINQFVNTLKSREDCSFFTQKWLLHLVTNLDTKSEKVQEITKMQIEAIASEIINQNKLFNEKFFKNEVSKNKDKELLLALIYTTKTMDFPPKYLELFQNYILDLGNKIFITSDKSFIKTEHYLLAQLFIEIDKPEKKWEELWSELYSERKKAMHSNYEDNMRNISHSKYLILVGMAAIEYFISKKNQDAALNLLEKIWNALMELYLAIRYFLHEEFLNNMIVRYIILKNLLNAGFESEINMVENNPELISNIIINLKNNNAKLDFLQKKTNILKSINTYIIQWKNSNKKKLNFKDDYYNALEDIYNTYASI